MARLTYVPADSTWNRFRQALTTARTRLTGGLDGLLIGTRQIDQDLLDQLETTLITADVGVDTTHSIMERLRRSVTRKQTTDGEALLNALRQELTTILASSEKTMRVSDAKPHVILAVGVNGVGKTTTIGKLTKILQSQGHSVLLAAGDTYRAAAIEQLQIWGNRLGVGCVAHRHGSDSASVVYDAIESAAARKIDVVLADTAGRLQNKIGLMDELGKLNRVVKKLDPTAPHDTILVLDATVGQNAISQLREFDRVMNVTGLIITKLDGTAKAGAVVGLANAATIPIFFVGLGEGQDDLQPFDSAAFADALLASPT